MASYVELETVQHPTVSLCIFLVYVDLLFSSPRPSTRMVLQSPRFVRDFLARKRHMQRESSSLSKHQPGGSTTASASLYYHLPRVSQYDNLKRDLSTYW